MRGPTLWNILNIVYMISLYVLNYTMNYDFYNAYVLTNSCESIIRSPSL